MDAENTVRADLSADVIDTCSGIALLYMGPEAYDDGLPTRLIAAMEMGNLDEAGHVTALMVGSMVAHNPDAEWAKFAAERWTQTFHPEDLETQKNPPPA